MCHLKNCKVVGEVFFKERTSKLGFKKKNRTLAGVAQCIEHWPMNQRVAG